MQNKTSKKHRPFDIFLYFIIYLFTASIIFMTLYFIGYIVVKGLSGLNLTFLTTAPNPISQTIGIFPSILNSIYTILIALSFALPIGIGGAIYLNEYATNKRLIRVIEFTTETLSGIPSIIFGVFGYIFFCLFLNLKVSILSGSLTLTLIVLPIVIRTTQEALRSVPSIYKEGALSMGATKWYTIRTILLPSSAPGVITAIILSVGRIVGESAALLLVAGGSAMYMPKGSFFEQIMQSGSTLAVELYRYAYSRGNNAVGFSIALVLLIIVFILNSATAYVRKKLTKENLNK